MEKLLSNEEIFSLRSSGELAHNEIAYIAGDLILAENVLTKKRRILSKKGLNESKKLLKG
jgi:hypothetical protein